MAKARQTQVNRIVVTLPARLVKDVDWLAPLEDMTRDELILEAIKRILKPHLEIRKQGLRSALEVERGKSRPTALLRPPTR